MIELSGQLSDARPALPACKPGAHVAALQGVASEAARSRGAACDLSTTSMKDKPSSNTKKTQKKKEKEKK